MNAPARTRIGRITLKSGGSVRLLPRAAGNLVTQHMRDWARTVVECERPPDGYAAIAYWIYEDSPGQPGFRVGYATAHHALPLPLLVKMAGASLASDFAAESGKDRAIERMGGETTHWTPDPAA